MGFVLTATFCLIATPKSFQFLISGWLVGWLVVPFFPSLGAMILASGFFLAYDRMAKNSAIFSIDHTDTHTQSMKAEHTHRLNCY